MKIYIIKFSGRLVGSIGAFQRYVEEVKADNKDDALLKLYEKYDHIHLPVITEKEKSNAKR